MDKSALLHSFLTSLQRELDVLTRAALMARDEATNEESKAENKYDTRGQEAAYLAEGQAKLAVELQASIALYQALNLPTYSESDAIDVGALVTLSAPRGLLHYFVGPKNGGLEASIDGKPVTLITPQSPLGRQLVGKRVRQVVLIPGRSGPVPHTIVSVE